MSRGLNWYTLNCRSLFRKLDEIICYFKSCDIICCSETWLSQNMTDALVFVPGKRLFRSDRGE